MRLKAICAATIMNLLGGVCVASSVAAQPRNYTSERGMAIDLPLPQAVREADAIIVGVITGITAKLVASDPPPEPYGFQKVVAEFEIEVSDVLKEGPGAAHATLKVWLPGGRVINGVPVIDEPLCGVGRRYILFLWWNRYSSTYELFNSGETTWELVNGVTHAVGQGKQVKVAARETPNNLMRRIRALVQRESR